MESQGVCKQSRGAGDAVVAATRPATTCPHVLAAGAEVAGAPVVRPPAQSPGLSLAGVLPVPARVCPSVREGRTSPARPQELGAAGRGAALPGAQPPCEGGGCQAGRCNAGWDARSLLSRGRANPRGRGRGQSRGRGPAAPREVVTGEKPLFSFSACGRPFLPPSPLPHLPSPPPPSSGRRDQPSQAKPPDAPPEVAELSLSPPGPPAGPPGAQSPPASSPLRPQTVCGREPPQAAP